MKRFAWPLVASVIMILLLTGWTAPLTKLAVAPALTPTPAPTSPVQPGPEQVATPAVEQAASPSAQPPAVAYDLGSTTIVQSVFPEDSRFRNMPVRLNGIIAVPDGDDGPYPVVAILHGNHPGCPIPEGDFVDRWPCDPTVEQPNYRGFAYLVSELAAHGYVALSININAENTFGFGETVPGERMEQLVDLHLSALAKAAAGEQNDFGVDLAGRADMQRLAMFGHSRGGEAIYSLANSPAFEALAAEHGYSVPAGVLLIAAATVSVDPNGGSPVPMAILLPACDGDVIAQDGQHFYEGARLAPNQKEWATSVWLENANHNYFNEILHSDRVIQPGRPDCETLMAPDAQRSFLVDYALDFLTTLFNRDPAALRGAFERMGMAAYTPSPAELYGMPARVATLAAKRHRLPLFVPTSAADFETSPIGSVSADGIKLLFCQAGWYTPAMQPGSEPCRRANVIVPGQPAHAVVNWEQPGGALSFSLPDGLNNLHFFDAVSLRAAIDPLSPLNAEGQAQTISVELTDRSGQTATVQTQPDDPALQFPPGLIEDDPFFEKLFTGRVPLTTIRLPLAGFEGVDLSAITEIALHFDGAPSGTLFLSDVELVRSPVSQQETLDNPPSAELIAAAEAGDVEAQRQLANLYRPKDALGVQYGNLEQTLYWYRRACAAGYANAQVDFYEFARGQAKSDDDPLLKEATACLDDAIRQGHRSAIISGAFRAAFVEHDYKTGFFLYALLEDAEPELAKQRFSFADKLTQEEIDTAEALAAEWRATNEVKDYNDFFIEVDSPFRQVPAPAQ